MEYEDYVEGAEFVAYDAEVESDDDGVEDHAEFEDQERGDLLSEFGPAGFCAAVFDFLVEGLIGMRCVGYGAGSRPSDFFCVPAVGDGVLDVLFCAHAVFCLDVPLRSKVEEEDEHDRCEHDGGTPGILRPSSRHTYACLGADFAVCWVQEMYESGSDDDAGAKIASEEVDVDGDAESWDSFCDDGEECRTGGYNHDYEEGGDAGAEVAVVFVA